MPPIITAPPSSTGGILYLQHALDTYPDRGLVPYFRVSEAGYQTGGKGKPKLRAKAEAVFNELRSRAPGKVRHVTFYGVERGHVTAPRGKLVEAARWAKAHRCVLVTWDLSRFIRAAAYHNFDNPEARPTRAEFHRLRRDLTFGVPLATILPPDITEAERRSLATKRGIAQGCKRSIPLALAWRIPTLLGSRNSKGRFENNYEYVASRLGCSRMAISRWLDMLVPPHLAEPKGRTDMQLRDVDWSKLSLDARAEFVGQVYSYSP